MARSQHRPKTLRVSVTDIAEDSRSLDAAVDAAVQTCGGDARAAVRALIVANNYLEAEVKRLAEAVSSGFTPELKIKGREQSAVQHSGDRRAGSSPRIV